MNDIDSRVYAVLVALFQVPDGALGPDLSPETVDGWDSLRHFDLMLALEDEFGVHFTVDEIAGMQNAAAIIAAVRAHHAGAR